MVFKPWITLPINGLWFVYPGSWRAGFNFLPVQILRATWGFPDLMRPNHIGKALVSRTLQALETMIVNFVSSMTWNTRWPMRIDTGVGNPIFSAIVETNVSDLTLTVNTRASSYTWFPSVTVPQHGRTKTAPRISFAWTRLLIESFGKLFNALSRSLDRAVRHVSKTPLRGSADQETVLANQTSLNRSRETTMQDVSASFIRQVPDLSRLVIFYGYELQHKYLYLKKE